ncbi:MAG: NAD(P)/FAD-dependent oxidoreductase [Candidatus Helarchaeota archaeon]|nr:NAD(P)/FAD-dependent oxidoreductase [Candidatus Helarchaeota archaeon]
MKIGIIGGGITGLTLGYELVKKGFEITIFEKEPELGGLAGCFKIGDTYIEKYYHHLFTTDSDIIELINELNLTERLIFKESKIGFFQNSKIFPFGTALDLIRFSPLSISDRIKFGLEVLNFKRKKQWEDLEEITIKDWSHKRGAENIYNVIWRPLLKSKFGDEHENIAASWLWGRIHPRAKSRKMGKEKLGYIFGGTKILFDYMKKFIEDNNGTIKTSTDIIKITSEKDKLIIYETKDKYYEFDCVFSTASTVELAEMINELNQKFASLLNSIKYQGVICVVLILNQSLSNIYWMNIIDPNITFGLVVEHTNLINKQHYANNHIVYLASYLNQQYSLFHLSEREIVDIYIDSLLKIFPEFKTDWTNDILIFKDSYATPIYSLNYSKVKPDFKTPVKNLFIVNTSQIYPEDRNMNNCIGLAKTALKKLEFL